MADLLAQALPPDFVALRAVVEKLTGIDLADDRVALVEGRLRPVMREHRFRNYHDLLRIIQTPGNEALTRELIDRLTTNHTHFHREPRHYEILTQQVIPEISAAAIHRGDRDLRVWCAAASFGQEPYELCMTLMHTLGNDYNTFSAGVLATDISVRALETARTGIYPEADCVKLPAQLRIAYLDPLPGGRYAIQERVKKEVMFRRFNLQQPSYPFKKGFDVIFCRNVLIYFSPDTQQRVLNRLISALRPGGYLFIGHAESPGTARSRLENAGPSVFRRPEGR